MVAKAEANGDPLADRAVATKDRVATAASVKVEVMATSSSRVVAAAVASGKCPYESPARLTAMCHSITQMSDSVGGLSRESAASGL